MPHALGRLKSTCNSLNKKDVRVLTVRGRKITITTASAKSAMGKLLMASIKMTLIEDQQNMSMKKIWI